EEGLVAPLRRYFAVSRGRSSCQSASPFSRCFCISSTPDASLQYHRCRVSLGSVTATPILFFCLVFLSFFFVLLLIINTSGLILHPSRKPPPGANGKACLS